MVVLVYCLGAAMARPTQETCVLECGKHLAGHEGVELFDAAPACQHPFAVRAGQADEYGRIRRQRKACQHAQHLGFLAAHHVGQRALLQLYHHWQAHETTSAPFPASITGGIWRAMGLRHVSEKFRRSSALRLGSSRGEPGRLPHTRGPTPSGQPHA